MMVLEDLDISTTVMINLFKKMIRDRLLLIPMTLAMAWGLTSGTILTLVWIPCAYGILEDFNWLMSKIYDMLTGKRGSETPSQPAEKVMS